MDTGKSIAFKENSLSQDITSHAPSNLFWSQEKILETQFRVTLPVDREQDTVARLEKGQDTVSVKKLS